MSSDNSLDTFFHRAGAYEICTALVGSTRTRQQLLAMIDVPERSIDRRLKEGEELGIIKPVPTTSTELRFDLNEPELPENHRQIIDSLLVYFRLRSDGDIDNLDAVQLHRDGINDKEAPDEEVTITNHIDAPGGSSTFL